MIGPLVIAPPLLSDVIFLEPALEAIARHHNAIVRLVANYAFHPITFLMNGVKPAPIPLVFRRSMAIYSFNANFSSAWLARMVRSREKHLIVSLGTRVPWWMKLPYDSVDRFDTASDYRASCFQHLLPCSDEEEPRPPRLIYPPGAWRPFGLPRDYVLLHPTSAMQDKCWPPERWGEVLRVLYRAGAGPFVMTSGRANWERTYCRRLEAEAGIPIRNLSGITTVRQFLATVSRARMVLAVDGSAANLAAAFSRPCLTLYGPTDPRHWHLERPFGRRIWAWELNPTLPQAAPMHHIPIDVVSSQALALLEEVNHEIGAPTRTG